MQNSLHQITGRLLMACLLLSSIFATAQTPLPAEKDNEAVNAQSPPALSLQVEPQQVKFTVQRAVVSYRFQVQNQTGEVIFDSGSVSEAEFLWSLRNGSNEALASGLYQYTLTIQEKADEAAKTQRGHFIIERADDRTADRVWVTTQDASGISVNGAQVTAARDGQELTAGARGERQTSSVTRDSSGRQAAEAPSAKKAPGQRDAIEIFGSGTSGRLVKWATSRALDDSIISESGSLISVAGSVDVTGGYQQGGQNALRLDLGLSNSYLGPGAGFSNTTGSFNTFTGRSAGYSNKGGSYNTFTGVSTGLSNNTGSYNTFSGYQAGVSNTTGFSNTFSGVNAGYSNTTGFSNTFTGVNVGFKNTTGARNTFIGNEAGFSNTTGEDNTFTGGLAGKQNTTGARNTFTGVSAGNSNTTGSDNTFSGFLAGSNNTPGVGNTFIGGFAGNTQVNGDYNTAIGYGTVVRTGNSNSTAIGANAEAGCSNCLVLGSVIRQIFGTDTYTRVGIGTSTPNDSYLLHVNGAVLATSFTPSDARYKRDIQVLPHALQTVLRLRGVSYDFNRAAYPGINFSNGRQMGFLAQEVEAVLPEVVSKDQEGYYAVNYGAFAPLLTEAVKEQQQMIESLQQENAVLKQQNASRQQLLVAIQKRLETVERTLIHKKRKR